MAIRQGFNANGEVYSAHVKPDEDFAFYCDDDGLTRQEFADECDINVLLAQYERTGVLNHYSSRTPQYLDVSDVPDLAHALEAVERAETAFMTLPASARREFDNDPVKFVEFAQDPANLPRMREWGLAPPAPQPSAEPSHGEVKAAKEEPPF